MQRILVVLPNWYGDTLFATPFLRTLRTRRPGAFIATLGWPQCREVLLNNPHVDQMLDYDEHGSHTTLAGKQALVEALRACRFDAAFMLRKSLSRSLLLWWAGIPVRIGFDSLKGGWALTHRVPMTSLPMHKASTYLPLLDVIGDRGALLPYEYTVSGQEREAARAWLRTTTTLGEQFFAVLHPGANWFHKRWAPERFAALGDRLAAQGLRIVITGGPDDVELAETVRRAMQQPATILAGKTTLRQLAACLEQARVFISNDTGILHLAAALRRPVVALYGPTSPTLTGPLGDPKRTVVLHHPECCPSIPCYEPEHPAHPGMDSIAVDEAYQATRRLLDAQS